MKLHINWKLTPPKKERPFYLWDQPKDMSSWDTQTQSIKEKGEISPRTLFFIQQAFQAHILPKTPWVPWSKIKQGQKEDFFLAESLYKRGRPWAHASKKIGSYSINWETPSKNIEPSFRLIDRAVSQDALVDECFSLSEETKTLTQVEQILSLWRKKGKPQHWLIRGGGILSDVGALAADLAGVSSFIFEPTTLLAMVDATVGGKAGVNFSPYGKNQVGRFAFPQEVRMRPKWLETLPASGWSEGASECIKQALLTTDKHLLTDLVNALRDRDLEKISSLLYPLIQIKAHIIEKDPGEQHLRHVLNLGHTLAHGLEAWTAHSISHGHGVALGLVYSFQLSYLAGLLKKEQVHGWVDLLKTSGALNFAYPNGLGCDTSWLEIEPYLSEDKKKTTQGTSGFILLKDLGIPVEYQNSYIVDIPRELCIKAWKQLPFLLDNL